MPNAEYMREYRKTPAGKAQVELQQRRDNARRAAVRRLQEMYPAQWQALFAEELRRLGLSD